MNKRILLSCPISTAKAYILPQWLDYVQTLDVPPGCELDYYFVDNSPRGQHAVDPAQWWVDRVYPEGKTSYQFLTDSWNRIRQTFLLEGYDAHFSLECDIFPPRHTLVRLHTLAQREGYPIVGCPYFIKEDEDTCLMWLKAVPKGGKRIDFEMMEPAEAFEAIDGTVKPVAAMGQGCILVQRPIYRDVIRHFRVVEGLPYHPDTWFYVDVAKKGIQPMMDTSIIPDHHNQSWDWIHAATGSPVMTEKTKP